MSIASEPVKECRLGADRRGENAAGDAQIPQRQTAVQRCREVMVDEQEGQKEEEEDKLCPQTSETENDAAHESRVRRMKRKIQISK